jgi:hypothetical protein
MSRPSQVYSRGIAPFGENAEEEIVRAMVSSSRRKT